MMFKKKKKAERIEYSTKRERILIDNCILSAWLFEDEENHERAKEWFEKHFKKGTNLIIPVPILDEFLKAVREKKYGKEAKRILSTLLEEIEGGRIIIELLTTEHVKEAIKELLNQIKRGIEKPLSFQDCILVVIAKKRKYAICTEDSGIKNRRDVTTLGLE